MYGEQLDMLVQINKEYVSLHLIILAFNHLLDYDQRV
jgi:hypothetical protein